MSGISLTASMRSNLLSLQNIASQQDIVQNRLATGLKVSSAIDNPSSYYTASSLNNRAADLTALLDAMSQGIQTIKAASEAIDAGTKFLEQAKAVANQALETAQPVIARVSNEAELLAAVETGQRGLIVIEGNITLAENQTLNLKEGQSLVGGDYIGGSKGTLNFHLSDSEAGYAVTLADNSSISRLTINFVAEQRQSLFSAINLTNVKFSDLNIDASIPVVSGVSKAGSLFAIENTSAEMNGDINFVAKGHNIKFTTLKDNATMTIGADSNINIEIDGEGNGSTQRVAEVLSGCELNILSGAEINAKIRNSAEVKSLYANGGNINIQDAKINIYNENDGNASVGYGNYALSANNGGHINISGKSVVNLKGSGNNFAALETEASKTGSQIRVGSGSAVHVGLSGSNATAVKMLKPAGESQVIFSAGSSFSLQDDNTPANNGYWNIVKEWKQAVTSADTSIYLNSFDSFAEFQNRGENYDLFDDLGAVDFNKISWKNEPEENITQFRQIVEQYDDLISDASYKGINLLNSQRLKINFNEDRSSGIEILGVSALSADLGIVATEWQSKADIEKSVSELEEAINTLRGYASQYGNYYSIVTTRQDFTENLINVLEEGADKLTLADMNQESANMLALQTSQQLAVNSLSLASQASQAVLRLF